MSSARIWRATSLCWLFLLAATWLSASAAAAGSRPVIFAAASLRDMAPFLAREAGIAAPRWSFAASSTLARQIIAGAPADLFLSADPALIDWVTAAEAAGAGMRAVFARNRLVAVIPRRLARTSELPSLATWLQDLHPYSRIALADPAHVPAGRYGRAALEALGLWADLKPRLVLADHVRGALAFVARGEVAAGLVYITDTRLSPDITVLKELDTALYPPIRLEALRLDTDPTGPAARLLAFMLSPRGQQHLKAQGFLGADAG